MKTGQKLFCSIKCCGAYKTKIRIDEWLEDFTKSGRSNGELSQGIRRFLIKKSKYKCSLCGWGKINPITNLFPLEIDHIDGNSKNNNPNNLRVLCPNCHSLTPTYRALNKKSSRIHRK